jgi:hypothetical protein
MNVLEKLHGRLVVSCQASEDSPLHDTSHIVALALAVIKGGAQGVRIEGIHNVRAVRQAVSVPIIGITKITQEGTDVYITPIRPLRVTTSSILHGHWHGRVGEGRIGQETAGCLVSGAPPPRRRRGSGTLGRGAVGPASPSDRSR